MSLPSRPPTVLTQPLIHFGREICGDLQAALRREWLVTNGLGGYATGTVAGINTRRYHGLLVAALTPPVGRTMLVGGMVEWATYLGRRYALSTHEYAGGTVDQHGYRQLQAFALEGTIPVWTFALGDALLERRVWMAYHANTTYITYRLLRGNDPVSLELTPLVTYRDFHTLTYGRDLHPMVKAVPHGGVIYAFDGAQPFQLLAGDGTFTPGGEWYWNFYHREEAARGLDTGSDLYAPGVFNATLQPGGRLTLVLTAERSVEMDGGLALAVEQSRQELLVQRAGAERAQPVLQQLVLAADQFIVKRLAPPLESRPTGVEARQESAPVDPRTQAGRTIIAGYPWFSDWGRDTMIALPGLTLATGRPEDAADILRTFARYVQDGLLPNNLPDIVGVVPGYNTVDASLWYVVAIHAYYEATQDRALVDELLLVLKEMVNRHIHGTRYGIGVDPADGLLRAGEPGLQLTWMDAKIGDWVVTPRTGKPVEINALWYNVLRILATLLPVQDERLAERYAALAEGTRRSFRARFIRPDLEHLADVVDSPDGDDFTLRPNGIFAISLPFPLLEGAEAAAVVRATGRALLTSYGLRSLAPDDPRYAGSYGGDGPTRDSIYHQGPVWTWPFGAYVEAHFRVYRDAAAALALLRPFEDHLRDAGLGSISEILDGDPSHYPRGCIAQAWGVAEILRVWRKVAQANGFQRATHEPNRPLAVSTATRLPESLLGAWQPAGNKRSVED